MHVSIFSTNFKKTQIKAKLLNSTCSSSSPLGKYDRTMIMDDIVGAGRVCGQV